MNDEFAQIRAQLAKVRQERDSQENQLLAARAQLVQIQRQIDNLVRAGKPPEQDRQGRILLEQRDHLAAEIESRTADLAGIRQNAADFYGRFAEITPSPQKQVEAWNDANPVLLLPVRIEAKFMRHRRDELWVRIFPDDIAVETHEPHLTTEEIDAGKIYWEQIWRAGHDATLEKGAWRVLVSKYGDTRAAWIANTMHPTNESDRPTTPVDTGTPLTPAPIYPEPDLNPARWSRAPRVRLMPDRFVVMLYHNGAKELEAVGNPIPDPLIVGPDPSSVEPNLKQVDDELAFDPQIAWLEDFDRAVEIGMGLRIPLTADQAQRGFDRVLVLGLRFASDENDGVQKLTDLFNGHHYTKGLSLIPQGTPTNNTETGALTPPDSDVSYAVEQNNPLFESETNDWFNRVDGQIAADALRLPHTVFQHIRYANQTDSIEARAMNTALFQATAGYFMEEMMRPIFKLDTIRRTRTFMTRLVSGRGPLPALRIGRQPYGIMLTSVFSRLRFSQRDPFFMRLYSVLQQMDQTWAALSQRVIHSGSRGDPEDKLLTILGLHASSVEYHQRFAAGPDYHWNYLTFLSAGGGDAVQHREALRNAGLELVTQLGYEFPALAKIFSVTFFGRQTALTGPIIDETPLSEEHTIKPLEGGTINYIDWLLANDIDTVRAQNFGTDGDGNPRPAPTALLYLLLRHALTLEYWDTTQRILETEDVVTEDVRHEAELMNMRSRPDLTRWDYFDAVVPARTGNLTLQQYLFSPAILDATEARELQEVREALALLAKLPTARLERLLAEHLDLCSYRLDAWLLGLVNLRLQEMTQARVVGEAGPNETDGIYLGAFGWLEDLRPAAPRQTVPANEIPKGFENGVPLTYAPDNAGYMHLPSLNHATAAAILRNAYVTHQGQMAVNLSSERTRRALRYFEGMRNGQPLGALLGYQFERGLHDRNATLDLDQYILPLRKKFPLAADPRRDLPTDTPAEAIAARNVVDGLALIRASRHDPYPYGVTELPSSGSSEGQAILAELERIIDSLDAIGDLALSEGVFQVAQGNFTRASAALDAVSKGGYPSDPEIVQTPRSGTALTHRVMLNFHDGTPTANPWAGVSMSPRAETEPRLNHWLGSLIGDPADIRCTVHYTDPATASDMEGEVTLRNLDLQPIDFVLGTSHDLASEATDLENRIAYFVRLAEALPQDVQLRIDFIERQSTWDLTVKTFFEILALVNPLREIITSCRALTADDFVAPSEAASGASNDRLGYQIGELRTRITAARDALQTVRNTLETKRAAAAASTFTSTDLDGLREALFGATGLGIQGTIPVSVIEADTAARDELVAQAVRVLAEIDKRLADATAALTLPPESPDADGENLLNAGRVVFGPSFKILPLIQLHTPTQVQAAYDNRAAILNNAPSLAVDEWLQGLTRVQPKLRAYDSVRLIAESFDPTSADVCALTAIQLPYLTGDRWLALPFEPDQKVTHDKLSLVMQVQSGFSASELQTGLLLDEWVEVIPSTEETTALAFHFDQPNSEPPQTLLLVVPPEIKGHWSWQDLEDTLIETLALAKKRAVEPDMIDDTAYAQLLPAIMTASTQHPTTISVDLAANVRILAQQ